MTTDHIFYELFRDHPEWLRELTGLPLPPGCRGSSHTLKQLEIRFRQMIAELTPLEKTRVGQELLERGIERGIEQGIERGRTVGELSLALRQLERKFPSLARKARTLVEALEEPDLLAFGEALLFFQSEEDCLGWLEDRRE